MTQLRCNASVVHAQSHGVSFSRDARAVVRACAAMQLPLGIRKAAFPRRSTSRSKWLWSALLVALTMTVAQPARAQNAAAGTAQAEALFQQGRELMAEGKLEQACKALETSLQLERAAGTLLNLGRCYELRGMLASAWSMYVDAENAALAAKQDQRAALAREHHLKLAPRVPKVILEVDDHKHHVDLWLDGRPLLPGALGLELPLDPGQHTVVALRKDGERLEQSFVSQEPTDPQAPPQRVVLHFPPVKEPETQALNRKVSKQQPLPTTASKETPLPTADHTSNKKPVTESAAYERNWTGPLLTGLGGAGVLAGVMLGGYALLEAGQADCDAQNYCSPRGKQDRDNARTLQSWGYGVGFTGGAIAIAGIATWLFGSRPSEQTVSIGPGSPGAGLLGIHVAGKL